MHVHISWPSVQDSCSLPAGPLPVICASLERPSLDTFRAASIQNETKFRQLQATQSADRSAQSLSSGCRRVAAGSRLKIAVSTR